MSIRVGTSGFSYVEWKGSFYPEKLPQKKMLSYYAERFSAVEINATFYRMPKPTLLEGWQKEVPADFTFVLKAPHYVAQANPQRAEEMQQAKEAFCAVARTLGSRLGPLLFQLPPHMKKDLPRLAAFLSTLPRPAPAVMEFGDPSWFSDDVYALLAEQDVAVCTVDSEGTEGGAAPLVKTARHGYLRLRKVDYSTRDIDGWAKKIQKVGWASTHVFFKHEDAGTGPVLARKLLDALGQTR